eukprot:gnl/TRDRNA2_/TRDRNA2_201558_c0_seq1.p1 gnl/TRDRNA2_/TRDRNA2_201558_c0~~gnl/TRDRNA2_/TRDRNA2_201558_c0_seq1.p1  ORF type:complete len:228 (-),score=33.91 gnl/TRDRNA2_/TRDRNA2_201558_c0_seq1:111-794(-)
MEESSAETCRLCFEGSSEEDGDVLFPCNCRSGVHLSCLRRWQAVQAEQSARSADECIARAGTCEVCGALLVLDGSARRQPPIRTAICRAHGGSGQVALRRIPTFSRASHVFSEFAASEGQVLELLEQDSSGEFFRVRVRTAQKYRPPADETGVGAAVAEGWLRHVYLEWPEEIPEVQEMRGLIPRMPPHYAPREREQPEGHRDDAADPEDSPSDSEDSEESDSQMVE